MRALRIVQSTITNVAAVIGAFAVAAVLACLMLGLRPAIVISGSMAPGIPTGSMTFASTIRAEDASVGKVVTLARSDGSGLVTHRVIANSPAPGAGRLLTLKGDANREADPRAYQAVSVGHVRATVPYLGYVALWMQGNIPIVVGLVILIGGFCAIPLPERGAAEVPAEEPAGEA